MHSGNNGFDRIIEIWFQCAETVINLTIEGFNALIKLTTKL